jgi:hypothetical protein
MSEALRGLPSEYNLPALLRHWQEDTKYGMYCHLPGRVERFYDSDQTADISLPIQRLFDGKPVQLPILPKCPVFVSTGGSTGCITMPISAGDTCLVCFSDRDIDSWVATGNPSPPITRRAHDLSDAFAIVGIRHNGNPISSYSTTDIELRNLGGKVAIGSKVKVSNNATSLRTVLDNLLTALQGMVDTHGDSPNSSTLAAFASVKSQIDSLLDT